MKRKINPAKSPPHKADIILKPAENSHLTETAKTLEQEWIRRNTAKIIELRKYVHEHLISDRDYAPDPLSLRSVINKLQIRERDFRIAMLHAYHCSWKQFLHQVRIEKAAELLLENRARSIGDIASMLGYSVPTHFTRAFRKYYGETPVSYRRNKSDNQQQSSIT